MIRKKIADVIDVNLENAHINIDSEALFSLLFDTEDLLDTADAYTRSLLIANQGVGLSATCLAASEDANIMTFYAAVNQTLRVLKNFLLRGVLSVNSIKFKLLTLAFQKNCIGCRTDFVLQGILLLFARTYSAVYSDTSFHILYLIMQLPFISSLLL